MEHVNRDQERGNYEREESGDKEKRCFLSKDSETEEIRSDHMDEEILKKNEEGKKGETANKQVMEENEDSDQQESEEEEVKTCGKRRKKPCAVPSCEAKVVHLPKRLRKCASLEYGICANSGIAI